MILVSLRNRTAERRRLQNACVWQTWQGYSSRVLSWSSLKLMFSGLLQKDLFKEGEVRRKIFETKLLSRLSHKVCGLLSSPVLLRKLTTIITRRNKKRKSAVDNIWKQKPHFPTTIMRFLSVNVILQPTIKVKATQQQFCSVQFNMANDEQCGSHLMGFDKNCQL